MADGRWQMEHGTSNKLGGNKLATRIRHKGDPQVLGLLLVEIYITIS